ncbi:hypothetical protein CTEN210_02688 [Chaetoceros tenuissimus]|uniref:aldehyde dehydrogenase (NAD(+)) n=1 Tax=Chaetoceros tenuissimus TaxID=426638 RepID=A0AAD3CK21_9STRA|nr:hypothetical protein CTEN210_02688 [Chaetoceros tenuissimus]
MPLTKQLITQHFINNEFVDSILSRSRLLKSCNRRSSRGDKQDIDVAGAERRDLLLNFANLMEENQQYLAEIESLDNGWADKLPAGKIVQTENTSVMSMTVHEPIGVVGGIIPWNFPILMLTWKLAPLLACGCTCVIKTSEKTPLTALLCAQLIKDAGFPPGVVNIVSGFGPDCGKFLALHPDVDKVAFTGSSKVGHEIVKYSGESNLKKCTLELGGKSPLIICDDVDLNKAVDAAFVGLFLNHGQCCCASSRIYVDAKIHDKFAERMVEKAKSIALGTEEGKFQGPQVDAIQFNKILGYIKSGMKEGATCVLGGKRHGQKGYYIEPTIFTDVKDDMKIAREEIFGPVMQLMKYTTIPEAIERANATSYGLAVGIVSENIGKAMGIAQINYYDDFDAALPFGGYKESGWGRDKSEYALENYIEIKTLSFPIDQY